MGRLFWRILLVFWAVLLILGLGIGYGVHLYFQSRHKPAGAIAAGPRAEIIVRLTDGMLEGNSREGATRTLQHWEEDPAPLPLVVDDKGVDLLGRPVEQNAYHEARQLVEREGERSVRWAKTSDGMRWIIYTPSLSLREPPEPDVDDRPPPGAHHGG